MDGRMPARLVRACLVGVAALAVAFTTVAPEADARGYAERTLKKGSKGRDVKLHQRYLTRAGFRTTADGHYGKGTRRSQRRFERQVDRRRNGRATRKEQRMIRRAVRKRERSERESRLAHTDGSNPTGEAVMAADGRHAIAPDSAPRAVKDAIAAANNITDKPYRYGGGHGKWEDSGYDCSGAVSYALHGAGLLRRPMASGGFMSWGKRGRGDWITVYAHEGHAYVIIAGLRFDTSRGRSGGERGPRWRPEDRSSRGFRARHPAGL